MNRHEMVSSTSGSTVGGSGLAPVALHRTVLIAGVLLCIALSTARAQGDATWQATISSAAWEAQLQYQEARVAAWHAADAAAAERRALADQAIVRAQREYQMSRSLSWWRARTDVYAGAQCPAQPAYDPTVRQDGSVRAALY